MQAMVDKRTVPSVMTVEGYLEPPRLEGAVAILPTEMQLKVGTCHTLAAPPWLALHDCLCAGLQVELWRADRMAGVMETDAQGHITFVGVKSQPVYSPHLLLGLPEGLITGGWGGGRHAGRSQLL
jgi:hypothetical protein